MSAIKPKQKNIYQSKGQHNQNEGQKINKNISYRPKSTKVSCVQKTTKKISHSLKCQKDHEIQWQADLTGFYVLSCPSTILKRPTIHISLTETTLINNKAVLASTLLIQSPHGATAHFAGISHQKSHVNVNHT